MSNSKQKVDIFVDTISRDEKRMTMLHAESSSRVQSINKKLLQAINSTQLMLFTNSAQTPLELFTIASTI